MLQLAEVLIVFGPSRNQGPLRLRSGQALALLGMNKLFGCAVNLRLSMVELCLL